MSLTTRVIDIRAREFVAGMADIQGPEKRLDYIYLVEQDCSPEVRPILDRAKEIVRNGR